MNQTGIEWTDRTWNPMTGCKHGCSYCYARLVAETRTKAFPKGFEPVFHEARLALPAKVKDPQVVFVGSMTDMMGQWWDEKDILKVMDVCAENPHHTFLWLTKRPGRYAEFIWPSNCWLGTTITNHEDRMRDTFLIRVRGVKRFLSLEPLQEHVNLNPAFVNVSYMSNDVTGETRNECSICGRVIPENEELIWGSIHTGSCGCRNIHQVIVGGQTGRDAVPMHPDWVRSVRDQCAAAGVPFFFKSWGEWLDDRALGVRIIKETNGSLTSVGVEGFSSMPPKGTDGHAWPDGGYSLRVGKKKAGRLLDKREHNDLAWRL